MTAVKRSKVAVPPQENPWYTVCVTVEFLECGRPVANNGATLGFAGNRAEAQSKYDEIFRSTGCVPVCAAPKPVDQLELSL